MRPPRALVALHPRPRGARRARRRARSPQAIPLDLEVGYRWVDVSGNEQMYRTQINDRPGLLLRSFNYTSVGAARRRPSRLSPRRRLGHRRGARRPAAPRRPERSTCTSSRFTWRRDRPLQRAAGVRQSVPRRGDHPGPADLQPAAQHLRRDARASSRQDHQPDPRVHAQHVQRAGHDDVPPRRQRVPAQRPGELGRRPLPRRPRLPVRPRPGRRHAGLAVLPLEPDATPSRRARATAT